MIPSASPGPAAASSGVPDSTPIAPVISAAAGARSERDAAGVARSERDAEAEMTEAERRVLEFERDWIGRGGAKEAAIRSELGLTSARYHQLLHSAIDRPEALAADPLLVRRLQRLRTARTRARAARTFRIEPTDS